MYWNCHREVKTLPDSGHRGNYITLIFFLPACLREKLNKMFNYWLHFAWHFITTCKIFWRFFRSFRNDLFSKKHKPRQYLNIMCHYSYMERSAGRHNRSQWSTRKACWEQGWTDPDATASALTQQYQDHHMLKCNLSLQITFFQQSVLHGSRTISVNHYFVKLCRGINCPWHINRNCSIHFFHIEVELEPSDSNKN